MVYQLERNKEERLERFYNAELDTVKGIMYRERKAIEIIGRREKKATYKLE